MSIILITVGLVACSLGTVYIYAKNVFSYWKRRGVPYIEPIFPFGNYAETLFQKLSFFQLIRKFYESTTEPVIGVYSLLNPVILVRDPKMIQNILVTDFSSFSHHGFHADEKVDPMADNILLQNGEKWKISRMKLSPAFTSGKLKGMIDAIHEQTESFIEFLNQYADETQSIEMFGLFVDHLMNVIASISFGIDIDCIRNPNVEFRTYGKRHFEYSIKNIIRNASIFCFPSLSKMFRVRFTNKDYCNFLLNTFKANLQYREGNNIFRKDFFHILMQWTNTGKIEEDDWSTESKNDKKSLSLEQMCAQSFLFFTAGYETSSATLSFGMYEIAKNPEIQQKAYEEIESVLEKYDGQLTYESINEMKYVENCLEETLRMHSAIGVATRMCTKDYKIPDSNVVIENGTLVLMSIDGIHHDPKYFEEPEIFKPERFTNRRTESKSFIEKPYFPFGNGPRSCIGSRLAKLTNKIAIIKLLQKFRFELGEQHQNEAFKLSPSSFMKRPNDGIYLNIFKR